MSSLGPVGFSPDMSSCIELNPLKRKDSSFEPSSKTKLNGFEGWRHTPETLKHMSAVKTGGHHTQETKKKIGASVRKKAKLKKLWRVPLILHRGVEGCGKEQETAKVVSQGDTPSLPHQTHQTPNQINICENLAKQAICDLLMDN